MKHLLIEKAEKRMKKLEPYVDFYGQIPTQTKSNQAEFHEYLMLRSEIEGIKAGLLAGYKEELEFLDKRAYEVERDILTATDERLEELYMIMNRLKEKIKDLEAQE